MDEGAKSRHLEVRQQRRLEQQPPRPRAPCPEFGARGVQSGDDATGDTMQPAMRPGTQHQHDFSRRVAEKHQVGNAKRFTTKELRNKAKNTGAMHLQLHRCHALATAKSIWNVIYVNTFRSVWDSSTRVTRNQDRGIRNCWQHPVPGTMGCMPFKAFAKLRSKTMTHTPRIRGARK